VGAIGNQQPAETIIRDSSDSLPWMLTSKGWLSGLQGKPHSSSMLAGVDLPGVVYGAAVAG
jgi:hypothetical protein